MEPTRRQTQVLSLLAEGMTAREVGEELGLATDTARTHIQNLLRRIEARNRPHAVALGFRAGWLD